jgi:GAF domain-containing protein
LTNNEISFLMEAGLMNNGAMTSGSTNDATGQADAGSLNLELLQSISLAVAEARDVDTVLKAIVTGLADEASCTLVRIWLTAPGDICESCALRAECPDQERCLHLKAGEGRPTSSESGDRWYRMDGDFQRFPLGVRIVGRIGASGQSEHLFDTAGDQEWIGRDDWLRREGIRTFVGHPLPFRGEILGVLGVFTRERLGPEKVAWLRLFADHAAVAIANARAFEEIGQLHRRLALENEYLREEVKVAHSFGDMVGQSAALRKVLDQSRRYDRAHPRGIRHRQRADRAHFTRAAAARIARWSR